MMKYLLDTHTAIWLFTDSQKLSAKARGIHNDPFDRVIVATAMNYGITLISADENIQKYDITCVWN